MAEYLAIQYSSSREIADLLESSSSASPPVKIEWIVILGALGEPCQKQTNENKEESSVLIPNYPLPLTHHKPFISG